jgi:hypothetical protein
VAYSFAYNGKFTEALELIETLKDKYPIEASPMVGIYIGLLISVLFFRLQFIGV